MGISKLLKVTMLTAILLSSVNAEEVNNSIEKCEAAYDKCADKCNDSEKCIEKCEEKYEKCTESLEKSQDNSN